MRNAHRCPPHAAKRLSLCRLARSRIPVGAMSTTHHPLRSLLIALTLSGLAGAAPRAIAAEATIVRVWPEYRTAESFVRIGEYFGGQERAPELIVRTRPDQRGGYYFLTRVQTQAALKGAMLSLEYFAPGDEVARVRFFPVDLPAGSRAVLAGLTGEDWPNAKTTPTAWRVRLLGPDGAELAREQSFLWALPTAPAPEPPAASPAPTA